jgi:lysophospholipase L1-like esterase
MKTRKYLLAKLGSVSIAMVLAATCLSAKAQTAGGQAMAWVGSWATSQQLPEPQNALPTQDLQDATLRQIVHLSVGGEQVRVHLSNAFGFEPLHVTAAHIAVPVSSSAARIDTATDHALTFNGRPEVTIPPGAEYISDPVVFHAAPLSNLAVTLHVDQPPAQQTGHPGSHADSYVLHGDHVADADLPGARSVEHWYMLAGVDVTTSVAPDAVVALGDSITDGHGSTVNGNTRWPDYLAARLQAGAATRNIGVLNEGIGGNRLLLYGLGPDALARFDRDVLAQAGVRTLIVLEGVNDIGVLTHDHDVPAAEHAAMVQNILGAYRQIVARAHAHGIRVIGATILPYQGSDYYHPGPASEADRQAINAWIRTPGHFDAVVDFDQVTRDPAHPARLLPAYDSGDHLHPSPAGYKAMADAIPLDQITR